MRVLVLVRIVPFARSPPARSLASPRVPFVYAQKLCVNMHFQCVSYIQGWAGGIVQVDMLPKVAVDLPTYLPTYPYYLYIST